MATDDAPAGGDERDVDWERDPHMRVLNAIAVAVLVGVTVTSVVWAFARRRYEPIRSRSLFLMMSQVGALVPIIFSNIQRDLLGGHPWCDLKLIVQFVCPALLFVPACLSARRALLKRRLQHLVAIEGSRVDVAKVAQLRRRLSWRRSAAVVAGAVLMETLLISWRWSLRPDRFFTGAPPGTVSCLISGTEGPLVLLHLLVLITTYLIFVYKLRQLPPDFYLLAAEARATGFLMIPFLITMTLWGVMAAGTLTDVALTVVHPSVLSALWSSTFVAMSVIAPAALTHSRRFAHRITVASRRLAFQTAQDAAADGSPPLTPIAGGSPKTDVPWRLSRVHSRDSDDGAAGAGRACADVNGDGHGLSSPLPLSPESVASRRGRLGTSMSTTRSPARTSTTASVEMGSARGVDHSGSVRGGLLRVDTISGVAVELPSVLSPGEHSHGRRVAAEARDAVAAGQPLTLKQVLTVPTLRAFFAEHLEREFAVENLLFWTLSGEARVAYDAQRLGQTESERRRWLLETFVQEGAPMQVNVSSQALEACEAAMASDDGSSGGEDGGDDGDADASARDDDLVSVTSAERDAVELEMPALRTPGPGKGEARGKGAADYAAASDAIEDGDGDVGESRRPQSSARPRSNSRPRSRSLLRAASVDTSAVPSVRAFEGARREVLLLLASDSWPRFRNSDLYKRAVQMLCGDAGAPEGAGAGAGAGGSIG